MNGLDVDGKPFTSYKPKYAAFKRKYIGGNIKRRKSKAPTKYKYAAKAVNDYIRLSGELFEDFAYNIKSVTKIVGGKLTTRFNIYILPRSAAKAHGLMKIVMVSK